MSWHSPKMRPRTKRQVAGRFFAGFLFRISLLHFHFTLTRFYAFYSHAYALCPRRGIMFHLSKQRFHWMQNYIITSCEKESESAQMFFTHWNYVNGGKGYKNGKSLVPLTYSHCIRFNQKWARLWILAELNISFDFIKFYFLHFFCTALFGHCFFLFFREDKQIRFFPCLRWWFEKYHGQRVCLWCVSALVQNFVGIISYLIYIRPAAKSGSWANFFFVLSALCPNCFSFRALQPFYLNNLKPI